jgi:alanine racemase
MGYGMLSRRLAYGLGMNKCAGTYIAAPERSAFVGILDEGVRIARAVHTVPPNVQ